MKTRFLPKILILILLALILPTFSLATSQLENYFYSLYNIITAWVTINPLEVNVSAPTEVEIGKVFKVEARVINKGEEKIENTKSEIHLPLALVLLKKESVQEIGVIPGKKEKKVSWAVKGLETGAHFIIVSVSGELKGDLVRAEASTMVEIKESIPPGRKNPFDFFNRFLDFLREWLK